MRRSWDAQQLADQSRTRATRTGGAEYDDKAACDLPELSREFGKDNRAEEEIKERDVVVEQEIISAEHVIPLQPPRDLS